MVNELYTYAVPRLSKVEHAKQVVNIPNTLYVAFPSLLILLMKEFIFCIAIIISYLALAFLCFLDKDNISRCLKWTVLSILNILVISSYLLAKLKQDYSLIFLIIIFGVVFFVSYEIVFIIKIKKRLYSFPQKNKRATYIVSTSNVFLFILIFRVISRSYHDLAVMILVLLCSVVALYAMILIQKLILYLIVRNKILDETAKELTFRKKSENN